MNRAGIEAQGFGMTPVIDFKPALFALIQARAADRCDHRLKLRPPKRPTGTAKSWNARRGHPEASSAHKDERMRNRMLVGASTEKLAPRPGTTSTVHRV